MGVNVVGLVTILIFYAAIAVVGILAARWTRNRKSSSQSETLTVGARDIGLFLGICTMSATWMGGTEITATAEAVYSPGQGLMWAFAVPGYALGLVVNAVFFAGKMRDGGYTTTLDPFQAKFGHYFGFFAFFVEAFSETLYSASILSSLAGTLEVVASLSRVPSVLISAAIAILYTMIGGLYSVAYTDIIQLFIMFGGLVLAAPFVLINEAVGNIAETAHQEDGWLGAWDTSSVGYYIDLWMITIFGGVPLQVVYQRVFSASSTKQAQAFLAIAAFVTCVIVVPPILIGAAGASTNWNMTSYMNGSGESPASFGDQALILPIALHYLTPAPVAYLGLGAVSAAVMSSMDSVLLAVGSLFGRNIYAKIIRKRASEFETVVVIRIGILLTGVLSAALSLATESVLALQFFCVDFCYVAYFPLFASMLYLDPNIYGAIIGVIVGFILRIGGGDYLLNWQPFFHYPGGDNFPVKSVASFSTFITCNVLSFLAKLLFQRGYIPERYDFLRSNLARGGRSIHLPGRELSPEKREISEVKL